MITSQKEPSSAQHRTKSNKTERTNLKKPEKTESRNRTIFSNTLKIVPQPPLKAFFLKT